MRSLTSDTELRRRGVLAVLCAAAFVNLPLEQAHTAEFDAEKLKGVRPALQAFVDSQEIAGAVAIVGSSQGVASLEAVGLRSVESKQPMSADTLFRIASMTKPITAIGIMQLAEEGKLSVDDPVEKHLPEFRGQMQAVSRTADTLTLATPRRPITIRDLLTHTSGLPSFPLGLGELYSRRDRTLAEATLVMSQRPLDFEPGSKWAYCNPGIDTLGRIIEVLSGQSYESFLTKRVFEPLGMVDTTPYPSPRQRERSAALYDRKEGKLVDAGFTLIGPTAEARHPIPAGGLYSTAADLARLYQAMLLGGELSQKRILSAESVATMCKVQTGELVCGFTPGMGFGFGWAVVREPQGISERLSAGTYGHGGAFGTQAWIDPKQDLFIVLLIQRVGLANADASELRRALQDTALAAVKKPS